MVMVLRLIRWNGISTTSHRNCCKIRVNLCKSEKLLLWQFLITAAWNGILFNNLLKLWTKLTYNLPYDVPAIQLFVRKQCHGPQYILSAMLKMLCELWKYWMQIINTLPLIILSFWQVFDQLSLLVSIFSMKNQSIIHSTPCLLKYTYFQTKANNFVKCTKILSCIRWKCCRSFWMTFSFKLCAVRTLSYVHFFWT